MKTIEGHDVKIFTDNIENTALEQIGRLMSIGTFSRCKVRIMPDVHAGAGCVIGFTGDLGDKVIPNIVGVDIYSETVSEQTRDESPMVYKPMAEIIANIADTVDILDIIKPVFNFKAAE